MDEVAVSKKIPGNIIVMENRTVFVTVNVSATNFVIDFPRNKAPPRPAGQRTEPETNAVSMRYPK